MPQTCVCPGCLGTCMSNRDTEHGPERCEACAGNGYWTPEEQAEYEFRMAQLDRSIALSNINDGPF